MDAYSPLFTQAPDYARTIVITCDAAPQKELDVLGGTAEIVIAGDERVDLAAAVEILAGRGYSRISCEGGPRVLAQLAGAGVLNELCLTLSPLLLAGDEPRITNGMSIADGLAMRLASVLEDDGYLFLRYVGPTSEPAPLDARLPESSAGIASISSPWPPRPGRPAVIPPDRSPEPRCHHPSGPLDRY